MSHTVEDECLCDVVVAKNRRFAILVDFEDRVFTALNLFDEVLFCLVLQLVKTALCDAIEFIITLLLLFFIN